MSILLARSAMPPSSRKNVSGRYPRIVAHSDQAGFPLLSMAVRLGSFRVAPSAVRAVCDLPRCPPQVLVQEAEGAFAVDGVPAVEVFDFGALAQPEVVVKTADLGVLVGHPGVFAHAVVVPRTWKSGLTAARGSELIQRSFATTALTALFQEKNT